MTPKEFEEMATPVIMVIAPLITIGLIYLFTKGKLKKIAIGFLSGLLSFTPDNKKEGFFDETTYNKDAEVDDNSANPSMIGTTAFYRKQQDES